MTCSFQLLECLVPLAFVRRSLFTNDASRSMFLAHLMTRTKEILQTGQGMVGLSRSLSFSFPVSVLLFEKC
jgi:hypothetical protein